MEEKLDGRAYRTSGVRGDVAIIPAGTPVDSVRENGSRRRPRASQCALTPAVRVADAPRERSER